MVIAKEGTMMKMKLLLPLLAISMLATSCSSELVVPASTYPGIPDYPTPGGGGGGGGGEDFGEKNMTVNFFLNYSNSDTPIATMDWWSLKVIDWAEVPAAAKAFEKGQSYEGKGAPDDYYPVFLGYSEWPSLIEDITDQEYEQDPSKPHIWRFETDYKQSNTLNLYGIWVAK